MGPRSLCCGVSCETGKKDSEVGGWVGGVYLDTHVQRERDQAEQVFWYLSISCCLFLFIYLFKFFFFFFFTLLYVLSILLSSWYPVPATFVIACLILRTDCKIPEKPAHVLRLYPSIPSLWYTGKHARLALWLRGLAWPPTLTSSALLEGLVLSCPIITTDVCNPTSSTGGWIRANTLL